MTKTLKNSISSELKSFAKKKKNPLIFHLIGETLPGIPKAQPNEKTAHSSKIIPVSYFPPLSHAVTAHRLNNDQNPHLHLQPALMLLCLYKVIQFVHDDSSSPSWYFHSYDYKNAFNMQADVFHLVTSCIQTRSQFLNKTIKEIKLKATPRSFFFFFSHMAKNTPGAWQCWLKHYAGTRPLFLNCLESIGQNKSKHLT